MLLNFREVQNWTKTKNGRRRTLRMDTTKWRRRKSAYNVENSIEEENESKSLRIMFASKNVHL